MLFEKAGRHDGQLVGRSPYLQLVHADADPALVGRIVDVEILDAMTNSLSGVICGQSMNLLTVLTLRRALIR